MKFGLALAGSDTLTRHGEFPKIAIVSTDTSKHMRRLGKKMWRCFVDEIADEDEYPQLEALRRVCAAVKTGVRRKPTSRWLTAIHVAYKENAKRVKKKLNAQVAEQNPDIILVTTHPQAAGSAYSVEKNDAYKVKEHELQTLKLADVKFEMTRTFRAGLPTEKINMLTSLPSGESVTVYHGYLSNSVRLNPPGFKSICRLYFIR